MHEKEVIYDEQIHPLMMKIIDICKQHKINMLADFSLGIDPESNENKFCTTSLPSLDPDDDVGVQRMMRGYQVLRPQPQVFAFTIVSSKG